MRIPISYPILMANHFSDIEADRHSDSFRFAPGFGYGTESKLVIGL
jgi:hypothetical protein